MVNKNQLRVAIAKDVLLQIRNKRYQATTGFYCIVFDKDKNYVEPGVNIDGSQSFKEAYAEKQLKCEVCALGAAFVSLINIENEYTLGQMANDVDLDRLEKVFGTKNIRTMEAAFECDSDYCRKNGHQTVEGVAAKEFGDRYQDDEERIIAIMQNIIRNDGNFILSKKLLAKAKILLKEEQKFEHYPSYY